MKSEDAHRILIASTGRKTIALIDGKLIYNARAIIFRHKGGESASLSIKDIPLVHDAKGQGYFFDAVEDMLGYKIRDER